MASLTSEFLNYIVFRYLNESGINKSTIDGNLVPPGALIKFVQKGIQYLEPKTNRSNDDTIMDKDFQFLEPLDLITKNVNELQNIIKEKKEKLQKEKPRRKDKANADHKRDREPKRDWEKKKQQKEKERERDREKGGKKKEKEKHNDKEKPCEDIMVLNLSGQKEAAGHEEHGKAGGFCCAWSSEGSLLVSGSGDSTTRIWTIGDLPCNSTIQRRPPNVLVLKYLGSQATEKIKDVTSLEWNQGYPACDKFLRWPSQNLEPIWRYITSNGVQLALVQAIRIKSCCWQGILFIANDHVYSTLSNVMVAQGDMPSSPN